MATRSQAPAQLVKPPERSALEIIKETIYGQQEAIAKVLPKAVPPDRYARIALMAITKQPSLMQCTPASLLRCVLEAAAFGLEPTGLLGGAWMVPFYDSKLQVHQAQLIISYAGLIKIVRRSGEITAFEAQVVRQADRFRLIQGSRSEIEHERNFSTPIATGAPPPDARLVYAVAKFRGGDHQSDVMTVDEVELVRARSKARNNGPWVTDWCEMARKTVAKRLCKYLPIPDILAWAMDEDEARDEGGLDLGRLGAIAADEPAPARLSSKGDRVLQRIEARIEPSVVEPVVATAEPVPEAPPPEPAPSAGQEPTAEDWRAFSGLATTHEWPTEIKAGKTYIELPAEALAAAKISSGEGPMKVPINRLTAAQIRAICGAVGG